MKEILDKIMEFVYDTLIFVVLMLFVLLMFVFASQWAIHRTRSMFGKVNAAPAPFAKKQKAPRMEENAQAFFYGMWKCKTWEPWKLSFMPGGKYSAILGTSVWEGTWDVKYDGHTYRITIEEHPIHNPSHMIKYDYPISSFERYYEVTD